MATIPAYIQRKALQKGANKENQPSYTTIEDICASFYQHKYGESASS